MLKITKIRLSAVILGLAALFMGGAVLSSQPAVPVQAATEVRVIVESGELTPAFDVDTPVDNQSGGNTYDVLSSGQNISNVDISVDGSFVRTESIDESGVFSLKDLGDLVLADVTPGLHFLHFVAHPKNGTYADIIVDRIVIIAANAPKIINVEPLTVLTTGGDTITITGENLGTVTSALVDGQTCTDLVVVNNQTVACKVPVHSAGYAKVSVTSPEGIYTKLRAILYVPPTTPSPAPSSPILPFLPLPPATGLFALGGLIITNYDIITWLLIVSFAALILAVLVFSNKKTAKKTARSKK
ncbi:MAG: IPT/TIG domain-containing protein [Candidatus Nomurabacteria bacterium]|jgi:hypothetical protein|nr:IPT/TIG domain-containing protein [Candidatus Nomurabacteria bacterium]